MNFYSIILFSSMLLLQSCSDISTNLKNENLTGVWESNEELSIRYNNNSWIPNNLHINNTEYNNVLHVRVLDPIACTDSYPSINNSSITFTPYGIEITVFFESENKGKITAIINDSTIAFSIHKTDAQPFFGPCD